MMPDTPIITPQYDHQSIRQAIDTAYLDTVFAATTLQRWTILKKGNPNACFDEFISSFLMLFRFTKTIKEMRDKELISEIQAWMNNYSPSDLTIPMIMQALRLCDTYTAELYSTGILATRP